MKNILMLLVFSQLIFSCNMLEHESQNSNFDEHFYSKYIGFRAFIRFNNSENQIHTLCVDSSSYIDIKKDGTISVKIIGEDQITKNNFTYEFFGRCSVLDKTYIKSGGGLSLPYWSGTIKLELENQVQAAMSFKYYRITNNGIVYNNEIYFTPNWIELKIEKNISIVFSSWETNYMKWLNC